MDIKRILKDTLTIKFDKAFGLDIGDNSVEIIELEKFFRFSVVTYGREELAEGIVEAGRILDKAILAEKVKKLLKEVKPKKVSTNKVIISLPSSQVYIKYFETEINLKSRQLSDFIIKKVSVLIPINIDKTYWDFIERPSMDKTKKIIIFFCVPKDIADSYVKFCNSIGLEVVSLSLESLSLARVILKNSPEQSLIMDIGSQATCLNFFDSNDKINMSIVIPIAGEQMNLAIAEKLEIDRNQAEDLKIKFGFKDVKENTVRPIILPILKDILNETNEVINYYEGFFKQKIDNIYLTGGMALSPSLSAIVSDELKRRVTIAESSKHLNLANLTHNKYIFPLFANVIGLGMLGVSSEFRDTNLLAKMPVAEVNVVNKLNLFKMGYLSPVNVFRTILNNRIVLIILIIIIGIVFMILLGQVKNYGFASVYTVQVN